MNEEPKVIVKTVDVRVPRWLGGLAVPIMKRLGAKSTKRNTIYGEEETLSLTHEFKVEEPDVRG